MTEQIEVDGLRIAFERAGEGRPLVLLHGILGDARLWRGQLDELADQFTVIAWDAPGCGRSSDPPESFRLPDYADCLDAFLAALDVERPAVCGLSFGGALALELYRRSPETPRALVVAGGYAGWAGSLPPEAVDARLEGCLGESELPADEFIGDWIPGVLTDQAPAEMRDEVAVIMSEFHPAGHRAIARSMAEADLRGALPAIDVPTLLLWGDADRRSPLKIAEDLHGRMPGSTLIVMPGVGHLSNVEAPEAFNRELRGFLDARAVD